MADLADKCLSELVRKVLPAPGSGEQWRVEIVDDPEDATAARAEEPIVRVHRAWQQTVTCLAFTA
jgi:hypothetical protein